MEFKLKPVTDTSWILHQNGTRLAMIIANNKGYSAIGNLPTKHFNNLTELCHVLGGKVIFEEPEIQVEKEVGNVYGYPIKHNTAHDLAIDRYPSYAKTKGSNNRFAAGYYSVLFSHGWVQSYCPKISTLDDNIWIGPFYTKLEMLSAISAKKKEIKHEPT
jgi:hypothetical protein